MSYNLTGSAYGGNVSLGKANLAAGTTTTYTIANAFTFALKGQLFTAAAASNAASPTLDSATGVAFKPLLAGQTCIFAFYLNASSQVQVIQGKAVNTLDMVGFNLPCEFPQSDDSRTPFGYLLASASALLAAPWVFGVGNMSGVTGLTMTFRDVMDFPAQPIVS